jgi:hypothetical protein
MWMMSGMIYQLDGVVGGARWRGRERETLMSGMNVLGMTRGDTRRLDIDMCDGIKLLVLIRGVWEVSWMKSFSCLVIS